MDYDVYVSQTALQKILTRLKINEFNLIYHA